MKLTVLLGTMGMATIGLGIAEASAVIVSQVAPAPFDAVIRTWWPVIVTLGLGLIGYARLTERQRAADVRAVEDREGQSTKNMLLFSKLDDITQRLSRIEGQLGGKR